MSEKTTYSDDLDFFDKDDRFLAAYTRRSLSSVRRDRLFGRGPAFKRIGASVRYSLGGIQEWLQRQPGGGEGTSPGASLGVESEA